jgi:hypothetical protein
MNEITLKKGKIGQSLRPNPTGMIGMIGMNHPVESQMDTVGMRGVCGNAPLNKVTNVASKAQQHRIKEVCTTQKRWFS